MRLATLETILKRRSSSHKYDFGHVLVVGGSPGMVGAPLLAGEAAMRTGAGLVTIASHASVIDKLEKRVREIMTLRLPTEPKQAIKILTQFIKDHRVSVLIIGPGQTADLTKLDISLLQAVNVPAVIDAGALSALSGKLTALKELGLHNNNLVLTPHGGEYKRLNQQNRTPTNFAKAHNITLVHKGHNTLVAHPDGSLYKNTTGNPGLATAGTGDVLSGIIAGLLAQGLPTAEAAEGGVYLHGLAGDLAAKAKTQPGLIASDVIDQLPTAFNHLGKTKG